MFPLISDRPTSMSEINEIYKNYKTKSEIYKINQLKADIKFINDFRQNFEQARLDLGQLNGGQKNKTTIGDTIYWGLWVGS